MAERPWQQGLPRMALGYLFALGITLPVLSALALMGYALAAALVQLGMAAGLFALSLFPKVRRFFWLGVVAAIAVWVALGGWQYLRELVLAAGIHATGRGAVLPLYAQELAILLILVLGLVGYGALSPEMGGVAPIALYAAVLMLLWVSGYQGRMVYTLPALAALLAAFPLYRRDGRSWKQVLPIALAISIIGFLLVPGGGAVVPAWKEAADRLRQQIMDHLFFTEPRDVFSLATEGYYPQGNQQLGGMPTPNDHPVMMVETPKRVYLRGTSRDEYTGRSWQDTLGGRRYLWVGPQWASLRTETFNMTLPEGRLGDAEGLTRSQEITVQMVSDSTSTLFVPQRVRSLSTAGDLVSYFNHAGEIFITRNLAGEDAYSVNAPLITAMDAGVGTLVQASAANADLYYPVVEKQYTRLPNHLEQAVYDLAYRVTAGAQTPYERAMALQNHLVRSYRYSLDVAMQPADQDFVTNFLFISKEGYCTYFASAMTVLCRMLGLPARYVEGYIADPEGSGTALVTGLNAHAWTEVYFHGFGWLTFDPTPHSGETGNPDQQRNPDNQNPPPAPTPSPTPPPDSGELPTPEPTAEPTPEPDAAPEDDTTMPPELPPPSQDRPPPPPFPWVWLLVLALVAGAVLRFLQVHYPSQMKREKTVLGRYAIALQQVVDLLAVRKLHRGEQETPAHFFTRATEALGGTPDMRLLGASLNGLLYGRILPNEGDAEDVMQLCEALWATELPQNRVLVMLRRMALPLKRRDTLLLRRATKDLAAP